MAANTRIFPAAAAQAVAAAVAGAPAGSKAAAGLTQLSVEIGNAPRLRLRRAGTVVAEVTYSGSLAVSGSTITLPAYSFLYELLNADIDTPAYAGSIDQAGWTLRIGKADDSMYVEGSVGPASSGAAFKLTGDLSSTKGFNTGSVVLRFDATIDGVATPPAAVATWLLRSTEPSILVPSDYIGIHSDYKAGATYPVNPNIQSYIGMVRNLDHDPNRGDFPALSWWAIETSEGVYQTAAIDAWVAQNTGKTLSFVVDRTPSFYQDATQSTSYNQRYPSYTGASAPPTDPLKISALIKWILNRFPDERWIFSLANEPNFGYNDGALGSSFANHITSSNRFDKRWDDTFAAAVQAAGRFPGPFYSGSARKLANAYKKVRQDLNASGYSSVKLAGPGWEGQHSDSISNSFRRWAECPTDGGGVGADWADVVEWHHYSYDRTDSDFLTECDGIISLASALGMGSKPIYCSEIGHEVQYASGMTNAQETAFLIRTAIKGAARRLKNIVYYKFSSEADGVAEKTLKYNSVENTTAKAATNGVRRSDFQSMSVLNGAEMVQAAILTDGRVWAAFRSGQTLVG